MTRGSRSPRSIRDTSVAWIPDRWLTSSCVRCRNGLRAGCLRPVRGIPSTAMRKPSHRNVERMVVPLIIAIVAAKLVTYVFGYGLDVLLVICLLAFVNEMRSRRWWLARRLIGRRVLVGNEMATVTGLLRTQPGDYVELDPDRSSSPTTLPPRMNLDGEVQKFVIRVRSFKCPVEDVSFVAPARWCFWLPKRFDKP